MCSFTMKPSMNRTSAAVCAEDSSARAARSFNLIASLIDISVLMSIFVILLGLILISAEVLRVGVIGAILISLSLIIIHDKFIPHRERTVHA